MFGGYEGAVDAPALRINLLSNLFFMLSQACICSQSSFAQQHVTKDGGSGEGMREKLASASVRSSMVFAARSRLLRPLGKISESSSVRRPRSNSGVAGLERDDVDAVIASLAIAIEGSIETPAGEDRGDGEMCERRRAGDVMVVVNQVWRSSAIASGLLGLSSARKWHISKEPAATLKLRIQSAVSNST